ncbi:MAG: hypothetical protein [Wendovervirus sonii]|uniref:Uncharacterized protein n=1 Tax=phage Lak_Megaphage_Sonny TaxID=3109229 RepID=A0ABZ0Z5E6_9CAUD|nr:MAG: hypothetical protein [phage Lak_Megaphage_Sonny]
MRELSLKEYRNEEKAFFKIYNEYIKKLCAINAEENALYDSSAWTDEIRDKYEKMREDLKKEYPNHNDHYNTDFFCWMTYKNVHILSSKENVKYFKKDLRMVGKKVQSNAGDSIYGKLKGIAVMVDDVYFVIDNEVTGKEQWISAVIGVRLFNINEHRSWKVVTNNKGYL